MTTATKTAPARKPLRGARLEAHVFAGGGYVSRVLVLTEGTKKGPITTRFHVYEEPAAFGRSFTLRKFVADGPETYTVSLGGAMHNGDSCTCKAGSRWGHCRHAESLRALIAGGRL